MQNYLIKRKEQQTAEVPSMEQFLDDVTEVLEHFKLDRSRIEDWIREGNCEIRYAARQGDHKLMSVMLWR